MKKVVSLLFFLSGIAGLVYEVVWAKHLSLFFGNTTQAHTIVLATFMGGLAAGYFLFGKTADRARSSLSVYGWMEIGICVSGILFVPILEGLGSLYISLVSHFGLNSIAAAAFKFLLSIFLLLVPTILMGGTLPVLSRFVIRSLGQVESEVGWLYFLNSLGAVVGSLLAGFLLIPKVGLNLSITMAASLNLVVGLMALVLRAWEKSEKETMGPRTTAEGDHITFYTPWQVRVAIIGIALSGAAALIYEIAWIRLLSLVLGSSTYSFSLMLAAFIAGIALGSFLVTRRWIAKIDPYLLFAFAELGVGLSIILTLPLYERLPFYFAVLASLFVRAPETFWLYQLTQFSICFLLMLLPTFFLGMTLPLVSHVAARRLDDVGERVGHVFGANTVGTLIGAVAAGLVLLPLLGIKGLIEVGILINLLVGASALWSVPYVRVKKRIFASGLSFALFAAYLYVFPSWDRNILTSGTYRSRGFYAGMRYAEFKRGHPEEILYYKDGANMTVTVVQARDDQIVLKVNGKPDASSRGDLPTQILSGQIPLLLKPDARKVLVIGLGSGITAGSVLRHPVEKLDMVEISPEVVEASRFFAPHNHEALNDPRLDLHIEDGKTFLKAARETYDVIISEPSNPWIAGIGNLFSVEFYREAQRRLSPDGLMVQWFHTYEMTDETLNLLLRTFVKSFEYVTLWSPVTTDLLLIGSKAPFSVDFDRSQARFNEVKVREDLRRLGVESLATILSLQVASNKGVKKAAGQGRVNEDLFPILEYEAPKAFFLGRVSQFLIPHDERRLPANKSPLYFGQYLAKNSLSTREIKDITTYHLNYGSLTRFDLARAFASLWLQNEPHNDEARWTLARIEEATGNRDVARRELAYLLERNPTKQEYLEAAARLEFQAYLSRRSLLNHDSPERALSYLHRLLTPVKDEKDRIYREIALVHVADRDYESALGYLEKALAYRQSNGGQSDLDALYLQAADVAREMGDIEKALVYARQALSSNPKSDEAKRKLKQLQSLDQ